MDLAAVVISPAECCTSLSLKGRPQQTDYFGLALGKETGTVIAVVTFDCGLVTVTEIWSAAEVETEQVAELENGNHVVSVRSERSAPDIVFAS